MANVAISISIKQNQFEPSQPPFGTGMGSNPANLDSEHMFKQ